MDANCFFGADFCRLDTLNERMIWAIAFSTKSEQVKTALKAPPHEF